ncbi:MAG: TIGR03016 family PEP-CTERM system-associated outer membrane protein [Methylomonas sp.]|nr:TIGR03016 family PEP-CTERM system-associated outer membrane protein [Methylomonas sp.]PPD19771.1 MAG: TIGR03016 family PEP-CTERM system-associated outer membrane protein [Methylomonas sp.]PPD40988.1 MAG: TIGR03016 family PEP-CTERM system-associated outer membrane protein [Methylomonas sp.]PPD53078.1 MAG: TIGR03016 family PEP-CTERM system-associated outer membrane protein [Methylomonas sp.]
MLAPSLSLTEMFSDNLNLSDNAKKSGFVTEVAPGMSVFGVSPWGSSNLRYRLQGLHNAGASDAIDINHQLQMQTFYQLVRNQLFVDSTASISQQNINNALIATDNLSGQRNRSTVQNFSISPFWTPRFGQYATGLFRMGYQHSSFNNEIDLVNNALLGNLISDSESYTRQAGLTSGSKFNRVMWGLNYSGQDQNRESGRNVTFEQYTGNLRYFINRNFNVFASGGFDDNSFATQAGRIRNGFHYTLGGRWQPSLWYSLEVGLGNNSHVTLVANPSTRLSSTITYRYKEVGLNTGSSWDANFNYWLNQATIGFRYFQETVTVQQVLFQQNVFGNPNNPVILPPGFNPTLPNLVDDVIVRKRGDLTFSYTTGKSTYSAGLHNERRLYELQANDDMTYGATGSWAWQFQPRLNFYFQPSWQATEGVASDNNRYDLALGVTRSIPVNWGRPSLMNTRLELRHINQSSDTSGFDFTENRATANFAVQF